MQAANYLLKEREEIVYLSKSGQSFLTVKNVYGLMIFHVYKIAHQQWKVVQLSKGTCKKELNEQRSPTKHECIEHILYYLDKL